MKNGFTLVEMIAVILVMLLISIIVMPSILNQINNKKEEMSEVSIQLLKTSVNHYLERKTTTYPKKIGNTYCITLNEIVESGELSSPIKDIKTGNEIALTTIIKATINDYSDYDLCIVGTETNCECTEIRQ